MKRSVAAAAALVLVTAGRTYPGAGTKKDSPGISRIAETRLLELHRSRWRHPHLRELGGRCSARRKVFAYGAAPTDKSMSLRPFDIYAKELTIVGSYAGTYDTWPRAIELLAGGRFDPGLIVDSCVRSMRRGRDP